MILNDNKIAIFEAGAFKDLKSVVELWLQRNSIETLDEKLFVFSVNLKKIDLRNNKIKLLSPKIFDIHGGNLKLVSLWSNFCIDGRYDTNNWGQLEFDLTANCTQ